MPIFKPQLFVVEVFLSYIEYTALTSTSQCCIISKAVILFHKFFTYFWL